MIDTPAAAKSLHALESACGEFGTLSAVISSMILIFIEGIGIAAVAFMLTFFNAMVRELRHDRAPGIVERQKICPEPASSKQYQQQDRAA